MNLGWDSALQGHRPPGRADLGGVHHDADRRGDAALFGALVKMSVFKLFPTAELAKRFLAAAFPGGAVAGVQRVSRHQLFQLLPRAPSTRDVRDRLLRGQAGDIRRCAHPCSAHAALEDPTAGKTSR
jgi:hypothetical protein